MKKFNITCTFGAVKAPVTVFIGKPEMNHHPVHFQAEWLTKERGGSIPSEIMESLAKLKELSDKNGVPFEELCTYALEAASATIEADKRAGEVNAGAGKDSSVIDENTDSANGSNPDSEDDKRA